MFPRNHSLDTRNIVPFYEGFFLTFQSWESYEIKTGKDRKKKAYTGYVVFEFIVANIVLKFEKLCVQAAEVRG